VQRIAALLAILALCLATTPARAQVELKPLGLTATGSVSIQSDYINRGISQTGRRAAYQGTLEIDHESGFYLGTFASNVDYGSASVEVDVLGGYRFEVAGVKLDIGAVGYLYPGSSADPYSYYYMEFAGHAAYDIGPVTLRFSDYISPNYQFESGTSNYAEAGLDLKAPWGFTLAGRLGYQSYQKQANVGLPDNWNWSVVASHDLLYGFSVNVGYYQTNISKDRCGGSNNCGATVMAGLSWSF
jgi:uncharacterized protein (TIGR02001 family)